MDKSPKMMDFCYFRGEVVPKEKARISIASHSLQYGSTTFAGMRGYVHEEMIRVFRLKEHHTRFMNSTKIMRIGVDVPYGEFDQIIATMIEKNAPQEDFYIRPLIFTETEGIRVAYDNLQFELGIFMIPLGKYYHSEKGLRLMISNWKKASDASFPTKAKVGGLYVNSSLATNDARQAGYDEALMTDHNNNIVEGSVANLFLVFRGEVYTPPLGSDLLEGITWRTMVELLTDNGIKVRHEPISRTMVYTCDELFLTGTAVQVVHAHSVDGRIIGDGKVGPITKLVSKWYQELINMKHPKSKQYVREYPQKKMLKKAV